jgi:hypothetical protein
MNNSASVVTLQPKRAARISADDVFAAADCVLGNGQKPTIQAVRAKMGRGSPNTIQTHLDEWWSLLGRRIQGTPGDPLPVPKSVGDALLQLWGVALREAQVGLEHSFHARELALVGREEELRASTAALHAREQAWNDSKAALTDALLSTRTQLEELRGQNKNFEKAALELKREVQLVSERESHQRARCQKLDDDLQASLAQRLDERKEFDVHIANTDARGLREIDRAREETKQVRRQASELERTLRSELALERAERRRLQESLSRIQSERKPTKRSRNNTTRLKTTRSVAKR